MGQGCSQNCGGDLHVFEIVSLPRKKTIIDERPDLECVNILEFERLVKLFAHPANNGKVNNV